MRDEHGYVDERVLATLAKINKKYIAKSATHIVKNKKMTAQKKKKTRNIKKWNIKKIIFQSYFSVDTCGKN